MLPSLETECLPMMGATGGGCSHGAASGRQGGSARPYLDGPSHHRGPLLTRVFQALTASEDYLTDLQRLGEDLKGEALARFRRFYYEEILSRSPETAEFAKTPVEVPSDCIIELLCSDEFMREHDILLQRAFPHLTRDFFFHVPKSGGTTIFQAFEADTRFCSLHLFHGYDNGWFTNRLDYLRNVLLRLQHPKAEYIFVYGHPTTSRVKDNRLKRGWDNAFITLRNPIDAGVSWINYVVTLMNSAPTHPDVIAWRSELGIPADRVLMDRASILELVPQIVEITAPSNAICRTLGTEPRLDSALEMAVILDVRIIRLEQIDDYIRSRGISTNQRMNVSEKYVELSELDHRTRLALYDRNSEDLKFYNWVNRHAVSGEGPWSRL